MAGEEILQFADDRLHSRLGDQVDLDLQLERLLEELGALSLRASVGT